MVAPTRKQPRYRAGAGSGSVSTTRKTKQPRLLPRLEPIAEADALSLDALTTLYRCHCGNSAQTGIRPEAVTCIRCGSAMKPLPP